jgi:hypothetical protein
MYLVKTSKTRTLLLSLLAPVLAFSLANTAHAELLCYESFDYTDGAAVSDQTGGTGWEAGWVVGEGGALVAASGLSHPNALSSTGLSMAMTGDTMRRSVWRTGAINTTYGLIQNNLVGDGTVDGVLYGSILVSSANWASSRYIISLYDWETDTELIRIQQNQTSYGWSLTDTSNNALQAGGAVPGETGSGTVLLVWKLDFNADAADQMTLWVDPANGESSSSISLAADRNLAFNQIQVRDVSGGDRVDEIRFGTTFDSVAVIPGLSPDTTPDQKTTSSATP